MFCFKNYYRKLSDSTMNQLTVETNDTFATLLEHAANNDINGFTKLIEQDPSTIDEVGLWYERQKCSKQMVLEHRTPLMVASMYGSIDVLKLILSLSKSNVNRSTGADKTTALHCAAASGSPNAADVIKLLLSEGADPYLIDVNGLRPVDMIVVSPKFPNTKNTLKELLATNETEFTDLPSSPKISLNDGKREYPVDPSLPDIKNGIYSTDEFRIYSFKIQPCSRAYSHDWTECPFVHPGENARRRDPRKFHYSCVPCPDFRKGACRRGDMCEYAHGVFECWLHPAQYRTRLCKDGTSCNRRVCFFAHTQDELRPLYPSPRAMSSLEFAAAMSLIPGSPSSFTPPMSPSANAMSNWQQSSVPNVPSLLLPGSNLQSSRLRSSLNARDQDLSMFLQRSSHNQTVLEDLFANETLSPRFSDQSSMFSPRNNSSVFNAFQQQQGMLAPINTNYTGQSMSPRSMEAISPMSSRVSKLARENQNQHQQPFRSLSSRELGSKSNTGSSVDPWSKWDSSGSGKADWAVNADDFGKVRRSSSFREDADVSWVQNEQPQTHEVNESEIEQMDESVLSAWIEQMQLDQLVALKKLS
ncbi:zinc finger CCCH domain-containing protein 30 [Lactuca sativa]|uniref:zinc finger CCCH domain-containing protein 30 n=1 Tax=Lactuca sativa TaxID=4236 RepID=UPI000CD7F123|nr:zinc finger CCCH domain-containing protein 30 [Lactuca sativa]